MVDMYCKQTHVHCAAVKSNVEGQIAVFRSGIRSGTQCQKRTVLKVISEFSVRSRDEPIY